MKVIYIAETSLTNKSAYSHHVIKMCDSLSKKSDLELLLPNYKSTPFKLLRKKFLLTSQNKFKIKSIINAKSKNFFLRIFFGYKVSDYLKKQKKKLIISRSILSSFFLTLFKQNHILEIHSEFKGLTKIIMIHFNFINSEYIDKIIFISKKLKNKFTKLDKKKSLVLHDGVDLKNFSINKIKKRKIKNLTYIGSFHKGKGVELICKLAPRFNNLVFNVYGDKLRDKSYPKYSNLKFHGYIDYFEVPKKLKEADIVLLPSSKVQYGRSNSVNIANYNSPLKMFDYLASGKIIIASRLDGICEVLKHDYNSIIVSGFDLNNWKIIIEKVLKGYFNVTRLRKNAIKTAKEYTWQKRASRIIKLANYNKF